MVIGIDIRSLTEGKRTGVEEYIINLLRNLFEVDTKNKYKLFLNAYKTGNLEVINQLTGYRNVDLFRYRFPNKILNFSFKFLKRPKIDKLVRGVDVFLFPNIIFFATSSKCKTVAVFHDLSFVRYPEFYSIKRRLWHFLVNPKSIARRANKIVAVSNSTKDDLVHLYKISSKKIKVIYSGINQIFFNSYKKDYSELKKRYKLPGKFILYLGTIEPRKNLVNLISAFEKLKDKYKLPHKLVLAGSFGWLFSNILKKADCSKYKKEIIFTGFINNEDKLAVYKLADIFVYPSFYEGFGFPLLEAMACGIPTITSYTSSLHEVGDKGCLLINPFNVSELSEVIYQVLTDKNLREKIKEEGIKKAKEFSWQKAAIETLKVIEKTVINNQ